MPSPHRLLAAAAALVILSINSPTAAQGFESERLEMVRTIEAIAEEAANASVPATLDPAVLNAMRHVPRHKFVPSKVRDRAYEDRPLPIGYGQTISQPYIVALMTDLLRLPPGSRVLEIGTGSGYQAAILAELGHEVYSIEIVPGLARRAEDTLQDLDYSNIELQQGDGYFGWPEAAPFDGIVVTAAATQIPPPLIQQLKPGGRMIIPVGTAFMTQHLMLVEKFTDGSVRTGALLPVRFVLLTRE